MTQQSDQGRKTGGTNREGQKDTHIYEMIYQLDAIEYLFVYFRLDMFRAYTPIFRSNGC